MEPLQESVMQRVRVSIVLGCGRWVGNLQQIAQESEDQLEHFSIRIIALFNWFSEWLTQVKHDHRQYTRGGEQLLVLLKDPKDPHECWATAHVGS